MLGLTDAASAKGKGTYNRFTVVAPVLDTLLVQEMHSAGQRRHGGRTLVAAANHKHLIAAGSKREAPGWGTERGD